MHKDQLLNLLPTDEVFNHKSYKTNLLHLLVEVTQIDLNVISTDIATSFCSLFIGSKCQITSEAKRKAVYKKNVKGAMSAN